MKLGASYNLFDGEELLKDSILSIRDNVDFISVVYQTQSNFGNPGNANVTDLLLNLKKAGLIDDVVHFVPNLSEKPHKNEIDKRNIGLFLSAENKCTHHLSIDTDELYDSQEFKNAKLAIELEDADSSVCRLYTYYKNNHTILDPIEDYYVSFIFKIIPETFYEMILFPVLVDPTRRMQPGTLKIFREGELMMHHFSYVRKNIRLKLENSSAKENFNHEMIGKVVHHFSQWQPGMDALMAPATLYKTKNIDAKFKLSCF